MHSIGFPHYPEEKIRLPAQEPIHIETRRIARSTFSIFGEHDEVGRLVYVARTRNGITPASREELFRRFGGLETGKCPFVNLPEARSDCSTRYWYSFTFHEIVKLNPAEYAERPIGTVDPTWAKGLIATHTYARCGDVEALDAAVRPPRSAV